MTEDRKTYIGGPAAATILNVNPWQTQVALWQFLTGRAEPAEQTDIMRSGQRLEPAVLAFAQDELGARVLPGPFIRHAQEPRGGHLDGVVEHRPQIVEAKTWRGPRVGFGDPGTDEVPKHIAAQAMHYLGLCDAEVCWVPVLFSGLDFAMYKIERDQAIIDAMRGICLDWWQRYVVADVPPPPVDGADVYQLFPRDSGASVIASDAVAAAVVELAATKDQMDSLAERRERLEDQIKIAMGDAAALLVDGKTICTWKASASHRFDSALFKAEQPQLYKQYCREQSSRRFLLKG